MLADAGDLSIAAAGRMLRVGAGRTGGGLDCRCSPPAADGGGASNLRVVGVRGRRGAAQWGSGVAGVEETAPRRRMGGDGGVGDGGIMQYYLIMK